MKNTKLLLIPLFAIFLLGVISAASITTSLFYESTNQSSLTIINGSSFGIVVSADSVFENSMTIKVDLLDSSGSVVQNLLNVYTTSDSYLRELTVLSSSYPGAGNYTIFSTATAASGQTATDSLSLEVRNPTLGNSVPVITSTPSSSVEEGTNYSYQITANDADNDALTYSLTYAPSWLSMNSNGLVTGTAPNLNANYDYAVTVEVSDGKDFATQSFSITVSNIANPVITIVSPIDGQAYNYSSILFEITTDKAVIGATYVLDGGTPVIMDSVSSTDFTKTASLLDGNHSVTFYVIDFNGNVGQASSSFTVNTLGVVDTTAPVVTIISPPNSQTYSTNQIIVDFTAVDLNLNSCYYNLNNGTNTAIVCNTPFTITASEGANTLTVYANDNSGNIGSATVTFNIDTSTTTTSKKKTLGSRDLTDPDGDEQYLSQFGPKTTTEEEEVLTPLSQPSSFALWFWLLVGTLILIVAVIILWLRR